MDTKIEENSSKLIEMESELKALMQMQESIASRLIASNSFFNVPPSPEIFDFRSKYLIMIIQIRTKYAAYFNDPLIFPLAIAYMDRVLWSVNANQALKKSPALPMTCLCIAMKFFGSDLISPKYLAKEVKCTTKAAILSTEIKVLKILEWNLNLITPAHFLHALGSAETLSDELDVLIACMTSWVAAPHLIFKPSLWAAVLSNNPFLLKHCDVNDLELARQTFHQALLSAK